jgi:hypothetical protein
LRITQKHPSTPDSGGVALPPLPMRSVECAWDMAVLGNVLVHVPYSRRSSRCQLGRKLHGGSDRLGWNGEGAITSRPRSLATAGM